MININTDILQKLILIGKTGKSYGILGWITIFSFSEKKENIFCYVPWFFFKENTWKKIYLDSWKKHKNTFIAKIKNINDCSMAKKLTNSDIFIKRNQLPVLKENNYYWYDIINFQVFNTHNQYLGTVINLLRTVHHDILIVKNNTKILHKKKILIPFIENKIVKKVNQTTKIIIIQWN